MSPAHPLLGRAFPAVTTQVSPATALRYAAATDDRNPYYHSTQLPMIVPPLCVVIATMPLGVAPVMRAPGLLPPDGIGRLLHYEEDLLWHVPLRIDAPWQVVSTLEAIESHKLGEILRVLTRVRSLTGTALAEVRTALFLRGGGTGSGTRRPVVAREAIAEPVWVAPWQVAPDQSSRYSVASGDDNAIHLDDAAAQKHGLRARILHGLCTLAFAQRAVVQQAAGGDPRRLRRLRARFSRPVYMGDALQCRGSRGAHVDFTVRNAQGQAVLTQGVAEIG